MISEDARFIYATNRAKPLHHGENSIVVFQILEEGKLKALQWAKGGERKGTEIFYPRHACLVPLPDQ